MKKQKLQFETGHMVQIPEKSCESIIGKVGRSCRKVQIHRQVDKKCLINISSMSPETVYLTKSELKELQREVSTKMLPVNGSLAEAWCDEETESKSTKWSTGSHFK